MVSWLLLLLGSGALTAAVDGRDPVCSPRIRRAGCLVLAAALLVAAGFPEYQQVRRDGQDRAARRLLLTLHRAELAYRQQHRTYARLDQLHAEGRSPVRDEGRYRGFVYRSTAGADTYTITARPVWPGGKPHTIDAGGLYDRPRMPKHRRVPTPQERVAQARALARAKPDSAPAWVGVAEALQAAGRRAEALDAARRGARLSREAGAQTLYEALLARAEELLQSRRGSEALGLLSEAVAIQPRDAEGHAFLGDAYHLVGRRDAAIRAYRKATELGGASARAWLGLGRAYEAQGKQHEASRCYLRVIDIGADAFVPDAWINESWSALERLRGVEPRGPAGRR